MKILNIIITINVPDNSILDTLDLADVLSDRAIQYDDSIEVIQTQSVPQQPV